LYGWREARRTFSALLPFVCRQAGNSSGPSAFFMEDSMGFHQQKHRKKKPARRRNTSRSGVQKRGAQPSTLENLPVGTLDPVFRRFIAREVQIQKETIASARKTGKHVALALGLSLIHQNAWRCCERISLSAGVVEMLDDICYDPKPHNLPENSSFHLRTPAWIKIEEEQFTPFYEYLGHKVRGIFILDSCSPANLALLKQQARFAHDPALDRAFAVLRDVVSVQMVGEDGTILFDLDFDQARRQWSLAPDHVCPYGECVSTNLSLHRCWRCNAARDLFSQWVAICMLALDGWFRQIEVEESAPGPSSLPRTPGPGEHHRPLTRVVRTIDVSVRSVCQADDEAEPLSSHASRGSWVERAKAQDPGLVKKEERQVPERKRTLRSPRYANYIQKHGTNIVTVKAHTRTIPLLNLPRTTRARARRYGDSEPKS
jgi:hypothetical protein